MSILDGILGSQIMSGNEEAWLRMMLDDNELVVQMGLPTNLSSTEKDELVKTIMSSGLLTPEYIDGKMDHQYTEESEYDETSGKTPAEWMIAMAMDELGYENEPIRISADDLIIGRKYKLSFPNSTDIICVLNRIVPNSFGDDYFFKNISGGESLCGKAGMCANDEFPLPLNLLNHISILQF